MKNRYKSFCHFTAVILLLIITPGCGAGVTGSWETIFSDNFNRGDGDPGSNWKTSVIGIAAVEISGNMLLFTSTGAGDNFAFCDYTKSFKGDSFRISYKFITGTDFSEIECAGFKFKGHPDNGKTLSLVFKKDFFAIGSETDAPYSISWLKQTSVNLSDDTEYYLELEVDGPSITGYIKNSAGGTLYEISATDSKFSAWSTSLIFGSKTGGTTLQVDDYIIEAFREDQN